VTAILLFILACAAYAGAALLQIQTNNLKEQHDELSAQIRTLNDQVGNQPTELPLGLSEKNSNYGDIIENLTLRLPLDAHIKHINASDNAIRIAITADGNEWLSQYINDSQSDLGLSIQTSRISQEDGLTKIELHIEDRSVR
jgi:hypothetical protein